jgi:hypothetical protein
MKMIHTAQMTFDVGTKHAVSLTNNALLADYLIVSSAGQHAQEDWHTIIERKRRDIANAGHTIWLTNALPTRVEIVQQFCNAHNVRHVLFVAKEQKGSQKGPPTNHPAKFYSADQRTWLPIKGISPVTGKITRATTGFWFDELEEITSKVTLDLGCFANAKNGLPLSRFDQVNSAYTVQRLRPLSGEKYHLLAVARLASPYAVWLRL